MLLKRACKTGLRNLLAAACLGLFSLPLLAGNGLNLSYHSPADSEERQLRSRLMQAPEVKQLVALINENFRFNRSISLVFGAEDGPLYEPELGQIWIPYRFLQQVEQRFNEDSHYQPQLDGEGISAETATMDALMHTLLHELGHALIDMHQIPVLGREEDAVDGLATWLLIEQFEAGGEIALSAADLFYLEGEEIELFEDSDFWGEHSLDLQRYYSILCHVYGSDPEQYEAIVREAGLTEERAVGCIAEYEQLHDNWLTLLKPVLKRGALARQH